MSELIGTKAPSFSLPASNGKTISFSDFAGKNVVIYFYPKDDTPGCTIEAKDFRDRNEAFKKANTVILGVSKDSVAKHDKFCNKYDLNFELIADEEGEICQNYGVWVEKSMFGKKYMGIERSTFLIDKNGVINQEWRKVKVSGHAEEVLKQAESLS